jgi:hypothetical protein
MLTWRPGISATNGSSILYSSVQKAAMMITARRVVSLFVGATAMLMPLAAKTAFADLRLLALTQQVAPGIPNGGQFGQPLVPRINDRGQVAFLGSLIPGGDVVTENGLGIWSDVGGSIDLALRLADVADEPAGAQFSQLSTIYQLSNRGQIVTEAVLKQGVAGVTVDNDRGIWSIDHGVSSVVLREGAQAPGTPDGAVFSTFSSILDHCGYTTVSASLKQGTGGVTSANDDGIWTNRAGQLALVARTADPAPGLPVGAAFQSIATPRVNGLGRVAFPAVLKSGAGGVTTANDSTIWSDRSGTLAVVAREGQPIAGVDPAARIQTLSLLPPISIHGDVGIDAELQIGLGGVTDGNNRAIWVDDGVTQRLVVREDQPAPGLPDGVKFRAPALAQLSDAGRAIVVAEVGGADGGTPVPDARSIWSEAFGPLSLVARSGDPAPGTPDGVNFSFTAAFPSINDRGQMAFKLGLQGNVTTADDSGIWAQDHTGALQLIAREGQMIEVAPGDLRQIKSLDLSDVNNRGQVAFYVTFVGSPDTYAAFVSSLVALSPGDYDASGAVGPEDYNLWKNSFGSQVDLDADGNANGVVDAADYTVWRDSFIAAGAGAVSVPEPTSALLLLATLGCLAAVRSRRE